MDFSFSYKKPPSGSSQSKPDLFAQAEEQFNAIRGCGVTPRARVTFKALTQGQDPASFEGAPYAYMLSVMGGTDSSGEPFSDDVWLFNPACITESGSYTGVITNFARIAKGVLPLEDVSDTFDGDTGAASITFTLDGEAGQWDVVSEGGAVAGEVLTNLAAIAAERGDGARLAWADVDGQRLVVFLNESDLADLAQTTGMEWGFIE